VRLSLRAAAAALGWKRAALAEPRLAERRTGYVVGGISPLGQKTPSPTLLDDSAGAWPTVLVSGGRRGLDVELAPAELLRLTGGRTAALRS
jgi:Cys-tRNA(Pro)/Cys-tRNA(Cys) deacylase